MSVWTVALVGLATLFAIVAVRFAAQQSVWTDETTQLNGLSLHIADQLRWLAGSLPQTFAAPPDRMPPLSYLLGSMWSHAFGNNVLTVRYLSVCLSLASIFALWAAARQYLDRRTALVAVTLLALSPNFIVEAAEIRAYAAFIFFSTLLTFAYLRLLATRPTPSSLDLWMFAVVATLCSYTHFFGVVVSIGALLCLLASYLAVGARANTIRIARKAIWPLLFYLIGIAGLIPFIISAARNSGGSDVGITAVARSFGDRLHDIIKHDIIKLIYRLFSHQSMLGIPGLPAAALLAGLTLMMFAVIPGSNQRAKALMLFLLVTFMLIALAGLTMSAFNPFAPSYNVWALPVTALVAATALTHRSHVIRGISALCISIIIAADCYGALLLATTGEVYAHTRSNAIKAIVDSAGAKNVAVLYINDAWSNFFALNYDYPVGLRQYFARGSTDLIVSPAGGPSLRICELNADTLLVAADQLMGAETLQFLISHPGARSPAYKALDEFLETHSADFTAKWTLVSRNEYLAQSVLALATFKARSVSLSPGSNSCGEL